MSAQFVSESSVDNGFSFPSGRMFWLLSFCYASFMALLLQKAVLPLFPDMHAGHGLLMNDAIVFHNMAVEIAQKIHSVGWSAWRIYPPGASANVGLLSAVYALLGPDPAWFIPFNAAAHATGALLIYRIGGRLVDGDVGKLGGLVAGICFLVFPSALQWYGQNHKDAFAIVGLLLALDAWLVLNDDRFQIQRGNVLRVFFAALSGATLLGLVRPYYVGVMTLGLLASFVVASVAFSKPKAIALRFVFIVLLAMLAAVFVRLSAAGLVYAENQRTLNLAGSDRFTWKEVEHIPAVLDKPMRRASELRAHFVFFGRTVAAGSEIDGDRLPDNAWKGIAYLPRALVVGLFAPFPDTWGERVTLPRLIGAMETATWYLAFLGGAITLARYRSRRLLAGAVFCAVLIAMLAYIHPNVGTLYRQRFGPWHFFMLVGCIGWVSLLCAHLRQRSSPLPALVSTQEPSGGKMAMSSPADRLAGSGAVVILITLVCYLGFFARDLMLTGQLGLGGDLDAFFSAAMIPMFFVSCLAMPLGDSLVLPFIAARNKAGDGRVQLLQATLGLAMLLLVGATCFAFISAPLLVALVLRTATAENQAMAVSMLRWFTPIIALSAWTVVGNAALNSLGKSRDSAIGQLVVPAVTLAMLVIASGGQIMAASIGGMLLGTLINVGFVFWRLRIRGLTLVPRLTSFAATAEIRRQYWPLVAAAILPAALVPMNYAFAAAVSAGTVAAWAFSSKIVILFSGLASVGATAVVLPQMAHKLMLRGVGHAGKDSNFLIALGVWTGGVLMLGGFLFAEPLVAVLLGKHLSIAEIKDLTGIVRVGLMQIPIVIVGALVSKLAIASGRTSRVMYAAIFAFSGNFVTNLVLVPKVGVMGVAIGALAGGVLSLVILLVSVYRQIGLSVKEIFIALACWSAWVAVCVGLISNSMAALISAVIALAVIGRLQWDVVLKSSFAAVSELTR